MKRGFLFASDCQVATRNEDWPNPCEVKQNEGIKDNAMVKMILGKPRGLVVLIVLLISACAFAQYFCALCANTGNVQCNYCMGIGVVTQIGANGIPVNVRCPTCSGRGVIPCSCRRVRATPHFGRERNANCNLCDCTKWKFDKYGSCVYCGHSIAQH